MILGRGIIFLLHCSSIDYLKLEQIDPQLKKLKSSDLMDITDRRPLSGSSKIRSGGTWLDFQYGTPDLK
jgi:hypothetical protein